MTALWSWPAAPAATPGSDTEPGQEREAAAVAVASLPSRLTVAAGVWLLLAPFALSYSTTGAGYRAYWNDVLAGIAVIALAAPQIGLPARQPAWAPVGAALGGWLLAAPFVLGYADAGGAPRALANDVVVGALLVVLAVLGHALGRRLVGTTGLRTDEPAGDRPTPDDDRGRAGSID